MNIVTPVFRGLIAGSLLALAACAAVPLPPTDALQAAEIAIANAEKDRAADYAPVEMRSAHQKLDAARAKPITDDASLMQARQLAIEARADADLASSKARLAKAEAVNQELQKSNNTLQQEIKRSSGG